MKTNRHRSSATSATSIRRPPDTGKDEFHLVPFVPWWRTNDRKRKLARLCFGWTAEAGERGCVITDAVKRVPTGVHSAIRDRQSEIPAAFTRTELLITLAVLSLLVAIVLPALAHDRARSARIICANNLRQLGMGMQLWGNDHGDRPPQEVPVAEGGTRTHPLAANTWLHFSKLSNELASPKILLCPTDSGMPATEFSGDPTKGYLNPNFANRATSYALSYRINSSNPFLAGDRNLRFNIGIVGCSIFITARGIGLPYSSAGDGWTEGLHNSAGNFLTFDGSVVQADNAALRAAINSAPRGDGTISLHFTVPR